MKADSKGNVHIAERINQYIESGRMDKGACTHISEIQNVTPSSEGCGSCLEMGDSWVHLRLCLFCGHVGCCDNSKNKHATKHYHESKHSIIVSYEKGEDWLYCYPDELGFSPPKIG